MILNRLGNSKTFPLLKYFIHDISHFFKIYHLLLLRRYCVLEHGKTGSTKHFCGESIQLLYFICDIDIKYLHCNSAVR